MEAHRGGVEDSWSACQEAAVLNVFWGDSFPVEAPVFDEDPISDDPRGDGEIDDAELIPKEVWTTDLVGIALKILDPLV